MPTRLNSIVISVTGVVFDSLASLLCLTFFTAALVYDKTFVWIVLIGGTLWTLVAVHNSSKTTNETREDSNNAVVWEKGFTDWFVVVKSVTSLLGVIIMNVFRQLGWYSFVTHTTTVLFLIVNITEAVAREVQFGFYENGLAAVLLVCTLPFKLSTEDFANFQAVTSSTHMFLFPLSFHWIILYTSWNACFSYGDNMSWMTRLVLVPPIVVSLRWGSDTWLGGRVLLLLVHLMLRGIKCVWVYNPGSSMLTPVAGSINNPRVVCVWWGRINLIFTLMYMVSCCQRTNVLSIP